MTTDMGRRKSQAPAAETPQTSITAFREAEKAHYAELEARLKQLIAGLRKAELPPGE